MKMKRIFETLVLLATTATLALAQPAAICDPPPEEIKSGDFGFGEQQAVIWDAFNDCPGTHWYQQYSLDNGTNWLYPGTLGTTSGQLTNGVFVPQYTHFFFLPADAVFITRAVPHNGPPPPTAPEVAGTTYTLQFPDGSQSVEIIYDSVPVEVKPKKPKKHRPDR